MAVEPGAERSSQTLVLEFMAEQKVGTRPRAGQGGACMSLGEGEDDQEDNTEGGAAELGGPWLE